MRVLYITFLNEDIRPAYKQKIHGQFHAFENLGCETNLFIICNKGIRVYSKDNDYIIENKYKRKSADRNIIDEFKLFNIFVEQIKLFIEANKVEFVYIRRVLPITPKLIELLKFIKKRNIKIYYEYPTFPWKKEMLGNGMHLFYILDKLQYKKLLKNVFKIVVVGKTKEKNKKIIEINNAINVNEYTLKRKMKETTSINLITVANLGEHSGFERLIEGLNTYYRHNNSKIKIYFTIVGLGKDINKYKELVTQYNLNEKVIFKGQIIGKELDELFDKADLGIASLGMYKINISDISPLKTKEYLARGIPFVYAYNEIGLEDNIGFSQKSPNNSSEIDIFKLIEFYNNMKKIDSLEEKMRSYAEKNFTWEVQMKKIIMDYEKK